MACFFTNNFKRQKKRPSFLVFQRQNILFIFFSVFFLHFASANPLAGVNPQMVPQIIGALTQVMGQAEDNCGPEVGELNEENSCDDFNWNLNEDLKNCISSQSTGSISAGALTLVLNHILGQKASAENDNGLIIDMFSEDSFRQDIEQYLSEEQKREEEEGWSLALAEAKERNSKNNDETEEDDGGRDGGSLQCGQVIRNINDILDQAARAVEHTKDKGIETCRCCMMPSVCLLGGPGRIVDLLRVGNYAGLLLGLNNNKICSAIQKTQQASMALDGISGTKCIMKGRNCKQTHKRCIDNLGTLIGDIEGVVKGCNNQGEKRLNCRNEIRELKGYQEDLGNSRDRKCGKASKAGQSQMMQAAMTGVASLVAGECKKDYEEDTRCDGKKDEELDKCCDEHPRADACKQDKCEGKQGAELDSCCDANPQSALCRGRINACHPIQLANDPSRCMEICRKDPTLPGCKNFCNLNWHKEICAEVCKTYEMPRCEEDSDRRNICDSNQDDPCCVNPNGAECESKCNESPELAVCQCRNNPGRCRCDREEDIPFISEDQCSTTIHSEDCEDPDDPACLIPGDNDDPGITGGDDDGGDPAGGPGSPFPGVAPFPDAGNNPNRPNPSGPTKYSAGAAGPGGGLGGLGGGGLEGGSGGGSGEEEGESGEEGDDPYENILAGLSGSQNKGQGYGGSGGRRGGRARSGSGFDLKKFLPKKKKGKKAGKKKGHRVPSSTDDIFDLSSQMMNRYCENNNINCIRK